MGQVKELCEAANKEVGPSEGVQIANFLCNGNYAISGGVPGCEAVERLAKSFKARKTSPFGSGWRVPYSLHAACGGAIAV